MNPSSDSSFANRATLFGIPTTLLMFFNKDWGNALNTDN